VPSVNATIATTMTLYDNGNGGYVNRYTADGQPYTATVDTGNEQGGYVTAWRSARRPAPSARGTTCSARTSAAPSTTRSINGSESSRRPSNS
jgi:hypothetical protein